ncbi:MAG: hypothetical protein GVY07_03070 [Bacteroidetes bacterium]|jgi:hypothetical protein|nr:hypothetical protein [Bacteroidota bacterium]
MWVKQLFRDVRDSKLTTLDQLRGLEMVTDGFDVVKLEQLQKDLSAFIKTTLRHADIDIFKVLRECLYDAFKQSNQQNVDLASIIKGQFDSFLANKGHSLKISPTLFKQTVEIGLQRYGNVFDRDLTDYMELLVFDKMVTDKIQEIKTIQVAATPILQTKSDSPYSLDDTKSWFLELCKDPDYQRHDGSPYLTAIDAELRKRHANIVGQTPSETTIKNHRRKLGFMQK